MRIRVAHVLPLCAVALICAGSAALAQGLFNPVIPTGRSQADRYASDPACAGVDASAVESFFGFGFAQTVDDFGREVAAVDPSGPAAGHLREGDLIVSVNGDILVDRVFGADMQPTEGFAVSDIDDTFIDRGIYVYGVRGDEPFQAVFWSCLGMPEPHLFTPGGTNDPIVGTFNALWPELGRGHNAPAFDLRLIVAGLSRIHQSDEFRRPSGHPHAPGAEEYCRRDATIALNYTITRSRWTVTSSGNETNATTRTSDAVVHVDRQFYGYYAANFDYIHNEQADLANVVSRAIFRMQDRFGCASPEFKDFERRVFTLMGAVW